MDDSITNTEVDDEVLFEATLRPNKFEDYIGQDKTKRNLEIFIEAARMRGDALDHVLFCLVQCSLRIYLVSALLRTGPRPRRLQYL